jgi:thiamine-monophosphate kinase
MMDLSDGLSSDLSRLCDASAVGARIQSARLPQLSMAKKNRRATFNVTELALHGGDDYELLFTVDKANVSRIPRAIDRIPITRIGTITAGSKILLTDISGRTASLENRGWDPFR